MINKDDIVELSFVVVFNYKGGENKNNFLKIQEKFFKNSSMTEEDYKNISLYLKPEILFPFEN